MPLSDQEAENEGIYLRAISSHDNSTTWQWSRLLNVLWAYDHKYREVV